MTINYNDRDLSQIKRLAATANDPIKIPFKHNSEALMLKLIYLFIAISLSACGGNQRSNAETRYQANQATTCINQEAIAIAPYPADIETAAVAVIAKCRIYTDATRRDLIARFPGYRDYIEQQVRQIDSIYMDQARQAVALARTARR